MTHYHLTHETAYDYPEPVGSAFGRAIMLPRPGGGQQVLASALTVDPEPARMQSHRDFHGNSTQYFQVTREHTRLVVRAESVVTVARKVPDAARLPHVAWEQAAQAVRGVFGPGSSAGSPQAALAVAESRLASPMVDPTDEVRGYALPSFGPGRSVVDVVADLSRRIHADFRLRTSTQSVQATLPEVLERRAGVPQDLAHLLIGCARSMGLAARYLTGYAVDAADPAHAWASVWLPGGGWLHVDPTLGRWVDERYVVLGWGRDHRDVAPLRGVAYARDGRGAVGVTVAVDAVDAGEAEAIAVGIRTGAL